MDQKKTGVTWIRNEELIICRMSFGQCCRLTVRSEDNGAVYTGRSTDTAAVAAAPSQIR